MIATTPMIAKASLQISLTVVIRRSLSIARRLPRWATGQSAVFLEEPEEGDAAGLKRTPHRRVRPSYAPISAVVCGSGVGLLAGRVWTDPRCGDLSILWGHLVQGSFEDDP